jgi:hypothetical protein
MAKQSKKERERNRRRREKEKAVATRSAWAESIGLYGGALAGGRMGLLERPLAGPLTLGFALGAAGTAAKLLIPDVDQNVILDGATSALQGVGVADAGLMGLRMRGGS